MMAATMVDAGNYLLDGNACDGWRGLFQQRRRDKVMAATMNALGNYLLDGIACNDADYYYLLDGNACDGGHGSFQCFNNGAEMN